MEILYEDNHLIAVNKRPGEIVQGDKTGDMPMSEALKLFLKEKYNKPGNVFAGVIHRLDRPVSGVVLFAKTSKALERLNQQFRERQTTKTYWAVVKNKPNPPAATLIHFLKKNEAQNKSYPGANESGGGLRSELTYHVIASIENYHLLEVNPITGRHHQIRVQLSAIGSPIKGDLKYGFPRSNPDGSIHLHARKLSFSHPITGETITISAPPPNTDQVWLQLAKQVDSAS